MRTTTVETALWDRSGLDERVVRTYRVDPAREIRNRFRWVGLRRLLAGSARAVWLFLTQPSARPVLNTMFVSLRRGPEGEPARRHPGRRSGTVCSSVASMRTRLGFAVPPAPSAWPDG